MKALFKTALAAFYPKTCAACGELIGEKEWLCPFCREMIERCDPAKRCNRCGLPKKDCVCKSRLFRFDGCVAPFINEGTARNAMARFKFRGCRGSSRYFAGQMALCVRSAYREIRFDAVCFVPMDPRKEYLRGQNPARLLATELAGLLRLPVDRDALVCTRYTKRAQHDLGFKERQNNVKGLYRCPKEVDGKVFLLVDDIKTSGYTLDACAAELIAAGAEAVFCVTALITYPKKKEKKVQ